MKFNGWNSFEDLAKAFEYTTNNDGTGQSSNDSKNNANNIGCSDIPNGFQSLSPELFVTIGEIIGNIIAGNIPFNVQNAVGNWLELVGQVILTYNTQQQYFQGGPGRYFNTMYYNVNNPFCSTNANTATNSTASNNKNSNESHEKTSNFDYDENFIKNQNNKIRNLELQVNNLISEINEIKSMFGK
ncbi:hypothetical protein CLPUN_45410 [Clostridium puniceum]|uniref:Uncharacterized protein n=1 Tax=Clostridium puniceum TaxID=29367 RepID=A0A1S8T748_9CLOT|nr:hypothetical protein [Clostridium puniceum]OOM73518.1 hypothetical protein CLPUN_45410 [Clostridium puniceum]